MPTHLRQRLTVIEGQVGAVLAQCFALLKAMSEVESMVRVLQLVTVVVEVAGNSAQPYLGAFAAALPEVRKIQGCEHLLTVDILWSAPPEHLCCGAARGEASGTLLLLLAGGM